jgi:hypothetical protein
VTPYDAAYIAVAEALDIALVTADARLARAPGIKCEIEIIAGAKGGWTAQSPPNQESRCLKQRPWGPVWDHT